MALNVQSDAGDTAAANAYISVAEFKAYHDARGNPYTNDDTLIGAAIVRATDYIDQRFKFRGVRLNPPVQTTQCPRRAYNPTACNGSTWGSWCSGTNLLKDSDGEYISGLPTLLKQACAEYGMRAMSAALYQDAPAPDGGRLLNSLTQKVDVIEESKTYAATSGAGEYVIPAYPAADRMIAASGLIVTGHTVVR